MFLSVLFHVSVVAFITSCYHCRLPSHSVTRLLILLVLYSSLCFACLGYSCLLLFFTQQLSAFLHLFLVHCFAFSPCPFGRYAGDFQYYLKGFTNTMLQSNFNTMPPFGTERKWHSSEGGIVTRICKNSLVM